MRYVIFDTETGGLDPATDAVVSIGAVAWEQGFGRLESPEFYAVVNDEGGHLDRAALRVNGFTEERIQAEGADPVAVWTDFVRFCRDATLSDREQILLGGHNAGFDAGFLRRLARIGGGADNFDRIFSHRTVCTMAATRFLVLAGKLPPGVGSLQQVADLLQVQKQDAHCALGDARTAADVLTKLIQVAR